MNSTSLPKKYDLILLLIAIVACTANTPQNTLPIIDLSRAEKQVVQKIDSLQNIVRIYPDSAEAWGKFGMNLYIHDLREEAIVSFERAAKLDTSEFRWSYLAAYTHAVQHNTNAVDWFARSLLLNPRYAPLNIRYGDALLQAGRYTEAESAYKKAQPLSPRSSHVFLGLARVAFARNQYQNSLRYLRQALARNPRHGEVYGLFATVYRRLKMFKESNEAMQAARALPANTKLNEPLVTTMIHEGVSSYWYNFRAREYAARARFHAAIKEYKKALRYHPTAETYRELGKIYRMLKNDDSAIKSFRESLALKPNDMNSLRALSAVYRQIGEDKQAVEIEEKIELMKTGNRAGDINTFTEREENEKI